MKITKIQAVRAEHGPGSLLSHGAHEYSLQRGKKLFPVRIWGQDGFFTANEIM